MNPVMTQAGSCLCITHDNVFIMRCDGIYSFSHSSTTQILRFLFADNTRTGCFCDRNERLAISKRKLVSCRIPKKIHLRTRHETLNIADLHLSVFFTKFLTSQLVRSSVSASRTGKPSNGSLVLLCDRESFNRRVRVWAARRVRFNLWVEPRVGSTRSA